MRCLLVQNWLRGCFPSRIIQYCLYGMNNNFLITGFGGQDDVFIEETNHILNVKKKEGGPVYHDWLLERYSTVSSAVFFKICKQTVIKNYFNAVLKTRHYPVQLKRLFCYNLPPLIG